VAPTVRAMLGLEAAGGHGAGTELEELFATP
jgi:hypothetical protein